LAMMKNLTNMLRTLWCGGVAAIVSGHSPRERCACRCRSR
jgi:hypothetical protein